MKNRFSVKSESGEANFLAPSTLVYFRESLLTENLFGSSTFKLLWKLCQTESKKKIGLFRLQCLA